MKFNYKIFLEFLKHNFPPKKAPMMGMRMGKMANRWDKLVVWKIMLSYLKTLSRNAEMDIGRPGRQIWENQHVNSWEFWKERKE